MNVYNSRHVHDIIHVTDGADYQYDIIEVGLQGNFRIAKWLEVTYKLKQTNI
jgi:hypothetical protein